MSREPETGTFGYGEDHSGAELAGADLSSEMLSESNFDRAILDDAKLIRIDAAGASFNNASLSRADLTRAMLVEARFENAHAVKADFTKADLRGVSFAGADLTEAIFDQASLASANLSRTKLKKSRFAHAKLRRVDLRGADLTEANLDRAFFTLGVRLEDCVGLESVLLTTLQFGKDTIDVEQARRQFLRRSLPIAVREEELEAFYAAKIAGKHGDSSVAVLFDSPFAAIDFERVLGEPVEVHHVDADGELNGSVRREFLFSRWSTLRFGVNETFYGAAWGIGFDGGPSVLPRSPREIEPQQWSMSGLLRAGATIERGTERPNEQEARVSIDGTHSRALFRLGMLVEWRPE